MSSYHSLYGLIQLLVGHFDKDSEQTLFTAWDLLVAEEQRNEVVVDSINAGR
jgi:hypothetical protein